MPFKASRPSDPDTFLRGKCQACVTCAVLLALASPAQALEAGVEAGLVGTLASNVPLYDASGYDVAGGGFVGLIVEQQFRLSYFHIDLWGDVQTPLPIAPLGGTTANYVPIDLGVRGGPALGPCEPYLGLLGQTAILSSTPLYAPNLNAAVFGLGADLGLDVAIWELRFGIEARAVYTMTALATDVPTERQGVSAPDREQAWEVSALLSVRYVIPAL
jgi:hypothetical protein